MNYKIFDLLIIYRDGSEKVVKNVFDFGVSEKWDCFYYEKNNHRGFIPFDAVRFFGREFDYRED